jgi:hypothetical protein
MKGFPMIKRATFTLAIAVATTAAIAQAPAAPAGAPAAVTPVVPPAKCEPKPVYPGVQAIQDERKREAFQLELKNYQDCIRIYVGERKAFVEASNAAIRAAVEEHNALMNKIREDQEAIKKEAEK